MIDPKELHALADGELSAEDTKRVRLSVAADPTVAVELSAILNLKDCVREKAQVFTCEVTYAASMKRVAELDRTRKVEGFVSKYAWGISGGFLVLIAFAGVMNRTVNANRVHSSDLASTMANFVPTPSRVPANAPSYDRWLDSLMQRSKAIPELNRLVIMGSGVADLDGRQVLRVEMRDIEGPLSLLVIPGRVSFEGMDTVPTSTSLLAGKINGMNCVAENVGERSIVLVGDRPYENLGQILAHLPIR